jgi:hypothetical protein
MEGVQAFDILQTPLLVYELLNNVEELPFSGAMYTELKSEYMFFLTGALFPQSHLGFSPAGVCAGARIRAPTSWLPLEALLN